MRKRSILVVLPALLGILELTPSSTASVVISPSDLSPGAPYQLVFLTSGLPEDWNNPSAYHNATSADISVYNTFVNQQAALNPALAGITFKAIVSTATVDARDNAPVSAPVYRLDDTRVASGYADLWDGSIAAPINVNQYGEVTQGYGNWGMVWTGTKEDGTKVDVYTLGSPSGEASIGWMANTDSTWIREVFGDPQQDNRSFQSNTFSFYAVSEVLVAVPEPATLSLLVLGGLALTRRTRR